jgi:hypothetical protein
MKLQPLTEAEIENLDMPLGKTSDYIISSDAFQGLLHNLRQYVFPTVKQFIKANIETGVLSTTEILHIACRVQWHIQEFCKQELDEDTDIASVLTISGRVNNAVAMPCGAYMQQTWPSTGRDMLNAIKHALKTKSCSKESKAVTGFTRLTYCRRSVFLRA